MSACLPASLASAFSCSSKAVQMLPVPFEHSAIAACMPSTCKHAVSRTCMCEHVQLCALGKRHLQKVRIWFPSGARLVQPDVPSADKLQREAAVLEACLQIVWMTIHSLQETRSIAPCQYAMLLSYYVLDVSMQTVA